VAVVDYRINGQQMGLRNFEAPKRSDLKHWYRAARKAIPAIPELEPRMLVNADITWDTIIFHWQDKMDVHDVTIARKRRLS
jgi:hypothetical protein